MLRRFHHRNINQVGKAFPRREFLETVVVVERVNKSDINSGGECVFVVVVAA